jgi:hypothetical protein
MQVSGAPLCISVTGAPSSISFSVPTAANGITVPAGGSTPVYGTISTYGGAATPAITQSVTCPSGVFPCSATASVSAPSGGSVTIDLEAGSLPVGTTYTHCFYANGQGQCLGVTIGNPGTNTPHPIVSRNNCTYCSNPTLPTDNDGSTSTGSYQLQDQNGNPSGNTSNLGSCSTGAQNVTIAYSPTSTTNFTISANASTIAFAGTYALLCQYNGVNISAGSLIVYDATPVITSVTPSTVTGGAANTITVTGHNFGNNPIVTIGGTTPVSQSFSGIGIGGQVSIPATFQVPSYPVGTILPVTVTSTGELGNAFFQNPQNTAASNPQSGGASVTVSTCPSPAVRITSHNPIIITSNGATTPGTYGYTADLTSAVSMTGGTYTWSTDNPQMVTFITPYIGTGASQVEIGILQTNSAASITVTYTLPCGGSAQDSFRFALSNDTTTVAWVDASPAQVQVPSTASVYAANPSSSIPSDLNGPQCFATLASWSTGGEIGLGAGTNGLIPQEVAYAQAWLLSNSGNHQPPNPFPTGSALSTYLGNEDYRLYQRFQAYYEVSNGMIIPGSVRYLQSNVVPGYTPIPCPGLGMLPNVNSQPSSDNGKSGTTAAGDLVYQIVEARLGDDGQTVAQFLAGPPGGDYRQVVPYVWSVIQFDVNGFTRSLMPSGNSGNIQIFPSYVLYSGQTQLFAVEESNWQTFGQLNFTSYFRIQ